MTIERSTRAYELWFRDDNASQPVIDRTHTPRGATARSALAALRPAAFDGARALAIFAGLVFFIPGELVVKSMGAAGRPATVLGVALGGLWLVGRLRPADEPTGPRPLRWVVTLWVVVTVLAYGNGMTRALTGVEVRGADRNLIVLAASAGVALWAIDEIRSLVRLEMVLRWVTYGAAASGVVALVQFQFAVDLTEQIKVPGLELNSDLTGIGSRGVGVTFRRVAGTAGHPIEFGVLSAMVLPLALHFAMFAESRRERLARWAIVTVLAAGIPISISRAAVIGLIVGAATLALTWRRELRRRALLAAAAFVVVVRVTVPGLVGTIRGLFTYADEDSSIEARTNDYDIVQDLFAARPWLGLGPGTFLPDEYIILDNEYLGTLVSAGAIGLTALLALFLGGYLVARSVYRRRALPERTRHLSQALAASMLVVLAASATFDALAFAGFTGLFWMLLGCIGAVARLTSVTDEQGHDAAPPRVLRPSPIAPPRPPTTPGSREQDLFSRG